LDLDGTLFIGRTPVPGAAVALEKLRLAGIRVLFLTNAGTRNREGVAHKLTNMGIQATHEEVYCGSYLAARYIAEHHAGKKAFVVGERGMMDELSAAGIKISEKADIVVTCLDRHLTYDKLAKAHRLLREGAHFIASNKDHTFPVEHGSMPGAGAIVTALEYSSKKSAYIVGKPNPFAFELMQKELGIGNNDTVMIGDRLDIDIAFAKNAGIKSALVLTGISKKEDIKEKKMEPDFVFNSLAELTLP